MSGLQLIRIEREHVLNGVHAKLHSNASVYPVQQKSISLYASLTISRGFLSSRSATNFEWRSRSPSVHSRNSTTATSLGRTQMHFFIFSASRISPHLARPHHCPKWGRPGRHRIGKKCLSGETAMVMSIGIALGIAIGAAIGAATHSLGKWIAFGAAVGVLMTVVLNRGVRKSS
jgi:hypothetical protein